MLPKKNIEYPVSYGKKVKYTTRKDWRGYFPVDLKKHCNMMFKDDVKEVDAGYECGISINNYNDLKVSDIIEAYKMVETKKKLD